MKKVIFWSFYSMFYFYLVNVFINSYADYKQQRIEERAKFAIADIERYFDKSKTYPSSIKVIYPNLEVNNSELYGDFYKPLPNLPGWGEIKFFHEWSSDQYILIVGHWESPNVIYFFKDKKYEVNSKFFAAN